MRFSRTNMQLEFVWMPIRQAKIRAQRSNLALPICKISWLASKSGVRINVLKFRTRTYQACAVKPGPDLRRTTARFVPPVICDVYMSFELQQLWKQKELKGPDGHDRPVAAGSKIVRQRVRGGLELHRRSHAILPDIDRDCRKTSDAFCVPSGCGAAAVPT
jgi:hypothetical protein